jgi:hypothetical protein
MLFFGHKNKSNNLPLPTNAELTEQKRQMIESQMERYQGAGITTKSLELGLWYQKHRQIFLWVTVWGLSLSAAVFWSFILYYIATYLLVGKTADQENAMALSEWSLSSPRPNQSANIDYSFYQAIPLADGRYDLVGQITNKKSNGYISYTYYFYDGQRIIGQSGGFLLPGETKFVVALGQRLNGSPYDVRLVLENILFKLNTPKSMPDWPGYKKSHLDFIVSDKVYIPALEKLSESQPINNVSFILVNNTAYTYYNAPFLIILYNGDKIVAIDRYIASVFESRQKLNVNLNFVGNLGNADRLEVVPDINIMNMESYSSPR